MQPCRSQVRYIRVSLKLGVSVDLMCLGTLGLAGRHGIWPVVDDRTARLYVAGGGESAGYGGSNYLETLELRKLPMSTSNTVDSLIVCTYLDDIDFKGGFDAKVEAEKATGCEEACSTLYQCTHFTYLDGWCYLRAVPTNLNPTVVPKPGSVAAVCQASPVRSTVAIDTMAPGDPVPPIVKMTSTNSGSKPSHVHILTDNQPSGSISAWHAVKRPDDGCVYIDGIDLVGHDLEVRPVIYAGTAEECEPSCRFTSGCISFTFLAGRCYLKNSDAGATTHGGAMSAKCWPGIGTDMGAALIEMWQEPSRACVYVQNVDLHGSDLPSKPVAAKVAEECEPVCRSTARCTHFTFTRGMCFLKFASGRPVMVPNAASAQCRWMSGHTTDRSQPPEVHPYTVRQDAFRQSCEALRWPINNGICGASKLQIGVSSMPVCHASADFAAAAITCQRAGARLCTAAEVHSMTVAEDDCGFGGQLVWTSDSCDGGFLVATSPTSSSAVATHKPRMSECWQPFGNQDGRTVGVQCCADPVNPADEPAGEGSHRKFSCDGGSEWSIGGSSEQLCTEVEPYASKCKWQNGACHDAARAGAMPTNKASNHLGAPGNVITADGLVPQIQQWSWGPDLPVALFEPQGVAHNNRLWVFGGFENGYSKMGNRAFSLDIRSQRWTELPRIPLFGGISHCGQAVDDQNGIIHLVGGLQLSAGLVWPNARAVASVLSFSTKDNAWLPHNSLPALPAPRGAGAAAILGRQLHFFGGGSFQAGSDFVVDHTDHWSISLDDAAAGWVFRAPLSVGRNHIGAAVAGGKIFAIGGQHFHNEWTGNVDVTEVYNPAVNSWSTLSPLPKPLGHIGPSVASWGANSLFVVGGVSNKPDRDQINLLHYDIENDRWTVLSSMTSFASQVAGVIGDRLIVQVANYSYLGDIRLGTQPSEEFVSASAEPTRETEQARRPRYLWTM